VEIGLGVEGQPAAPGTDPLGDLGFGMWIDDRSQLPLIRDRLAERMHRKSEITVLRLFRDGHDVSWFDSARADFRKNDSIRARSWVLAVYEDYLKHRFPDLKPEEEGTTREKQYARRYSTNNLPRDIARVAVTLNKAEEDRLAQEFACYGYAIHKEGNKKIAVGPEFELDMVSAPRGAPRKLAIWVKLNRAKEGPQDLKIGDTSELRFDGDSAIWYFPKAW
jgi:Family of unknown function (DUF5829)